jgi:gamma-glutamyltranspeptidase/glutathione hydrolase
MPRTALACVSQDAADVGARMADRGGNAVDAALAASLTAVVTHPGMCSLGGGGFVTIWPADGEPVTVEGGLEMPGRGLPDRRFADGGVRAEMEYGGGLTTVVGPGSVATPGLLAACSRASEGWGELPWSDLLEPAEARAREGFPLPPSCHAFLVHAFEPIYARDPRSRAALGDGSGGLTEPGSTVRVPHLAESLRALADEGVGLLYGGELGRRVADHVQEGGGVLTLDDLAAYEPAEREPLEAALDGWRVATNPPPALGGSALAAMLKLCADRPRGGAWTPEDALHLVRAQETVLGLQREHMEATDDPAAVAEVLLARDRADGGGRASSATLHTSAVDEEGTVCSVTLSDGYGSGVMPPGTGMWLNNCLGERELNPRGFHARRPGTRLPSNMTPTVAGGPDGERLAVGSPGAERIPTAVLQVLLAHVRLGMPLREAVAHPRVHADPGPEATDVAFEPGVPTGALEGARGRDGRRIELRRYPEPSMYFGGVEVATWSPAAGFATAADPRRTGGTAVGGG